MMKEVPAEICVNCEEDYVDSGVACGIITGKDNQVQS